MTGMAQLEQAQTWSEAILWSPPAIAGLLTLVAATLTLMGTVALGVWKSWVEAKAARLAREHEMKRASYLRLIEPLIEQTLTLQRVYVGEVIAEPLRKTLPPLMEIHLFASAKAIRALIASSQCLMVEMFWATLVNPQPPTGPVPSPSNVFASFQALRRYTEALIPLLVEARKDLGLDEALGGPELIEEQLREHFAETSRIMQRFFYLLSALLAIASQRATPPIPSFDD